MQSCSGLPAAAIPQRSQSTGAISGGNFRRKRENVVFCDQSSVWPLSPRWQLSLQAGHQRLHLCFSLTLAQGEHGWRGKAPQEAQGCLLSPCAGSSRHLMLVEHLELIFRPTKCSSTSRATPAVPCVTHGTNQLGFAACNFPVLLAQQPLGFGALSQ